ncbi:hypothetical protein PIB30_031168 [Stylosanthes scabra]|uniref:TRF2/HOY1 PH-like domain-containing protein n=1 Tax=Stylosanthes scabra TaxID=79078 RepID=A0ABU6Z9J6_9FABA|nr:hypothetical protein [Stylosanthes scabra]
MVQLMRSDHHCFKKVKLESKEDHLLPSPTKRPKFDIQPKSDDSIAGSYNPLDEPSPLGLRLRKSPSLLDLIQMKLSQQQQDDNTSSKKDRGSKASSSAAANDSKLKASNFPGTVLKIGTWEYKSRYEGDLVAKCYFAKHKLVWEVLDGCLKNKIEIPWSDIMALKANYPDDAPGTLEVVLARRPLFFREINPQPRKHTLWQATSDFTGGQASVHRRHFLQCPQGLLGKHFEKLIQCDPRLNFLSQQEEIVLECPYFETGNGIDDQIEPSCFDRKSDMQAGFFGLRDVESGSAAQSSSSKSEHNLGKAFENASQEITSPSSVNTHAIRDLGNRGAETLKILSNLDQIKLSGLHPSMSMNDLVNHIETCISEQMASGNPNFTGGDGQLSRSVLEEFTQCLFNDNTQLTASVPDEHYVMSRVNSLCCLLQKDNNINNNTSTATTDTMRRNGNNGVDANGKIGGGESNTNNNTNQCKSKGIDLELNQQDAGDGSGCNKQQGSGGLSRKESVGDLLLNLPRIASLPQFLFPMSEDHVNQVR